MSGDEVEKVARIVARVMGRDNHALAMQTAHEIVYLLAAPLPPALDLEKVEKAFQSSLSAMIEARDRLLCYHARTSDLDYNINEARSVLSDIRKALGKE